VFLPLDHCHYLHLKHINIPLKPVSKYT